MSWHFLQGQAEGSWEVLLRSIPFAVPFCSRGNAMVTSIDSRSGMTCKRSTVDRGAGTWTSSAADSHAKTSASPQAVAPQESTVQKAVFGWRWPESFARFDRATYSWKIRQLSLFEGLDAFSEIWPQWGSMRDGECSEQTPSGHLISENGSGLLPTLRASESRNGFSMRPAELTRHVPGISALLRVASSVLPGTAEIESMLNANAAKKLETVRRLLREGNLPTPMATPYGSMTGGGASIEQRIGGQWICFREWMMGWPLGWTASEPLETDRFHKWLHWHGGR